MNKLLLLPICLQPTNRLSNKGEKRILQYKDGLSKLFEYNDNFVKNNIDIILFDNTIDSIDDIPVTIKDVLPSNVKVFTKIVNDYGKINKGAGLIEQWLHNKEIIKKYDYFIHFEPRQLLKSNQFIESFLENPRNLFTINTNTPTFNTGIFCIEVKYLLKYICNVDLNSMVSNYISIENDLYNFFINNNFKFYTLEKMDLLWFANNKITYHW